MEKIKIEENTSYSFLVTKRNERLGTNGETITSYQATMLNEEDIVMCVMNFTMPDKFIYDFVAVDYTYENREYYDKVIRKMMNELETKQAQ